MLRHHHQTFPFRRNRDSQAIPVAHEFPGFNTSTVQINEKKNDEMKRIILPIMNTM